MKKIIFINRYFYPDYSATSQILTDLLFNLHIDEVELHVITSRLLYEGGDKVLHAKENVEGVCIHRIWTTNFGRLNLIGRVFDYLSFYIVSFFMMLVLIKKNDVLVSKTDPPMISVLSALAVKVKKGVLINWLQDLFPEVALQLGVKGLSGGVLYKFVKTIRNWSLNIASKNVVIGEVMAAKVGAELQRDDNIKVINNWFVGQSIEPVDQMSNPLRHEWGLDEKFVVGYSGNLGRAHDYETIYECISAMSNNENVKFVFIGGGAGMDKLKYLVEANKLKNTIFKSYQSIELLSNSLSVPDVHIVTLDSKLEGLIVPSKTYGILAVSRPIIFIGSKQGEFSRMLDISDCGYIVGSKESRKMCKIISSLKNDAALYQDKSKNSQDLYREKFIHGKSISDWEGLLVAAIH